MTDLIEQLISTPGGRRDYQRERTLLEVTEAVCRVLDNNRGLTRAELARRMGTSRAKITRMLDGPDNLRLCQIADMLTVMDYELVCDVRPIPKEVRR